MRHLLLPALVLYLCPTSSSAQGRSWERGLEQAHIRNATDAEAAHRWMVRYIWSEASDVPRDILAFRVARSVAVPEISPERSLKDLLERAEALGTNVNGVVGEAYHYIPKRAIRRNHVVVVHHGHACSFDDPYTQGGVAHDYGMRPLIKDLLSQGYSVLAVYMPNQSPHNCMKYEDAHAGLSMTTFIEPMTRYLNFLEKEYPAYGIGSRGVVMTGLSGGGWMSTFYPALDRRVKVSIPVAGAMPLSIRAGGSMGDVEQNIPMFYDHVNYLDLYILSAWGGRRQVQVLNTNDDCCFGRSEEQFKYPAGLAASRKNYELVLRHYERSVGAILANNGYYALRIDDEAGGHVISAGTRAEIVRQAGR